MPRLRPGHFCFETVQTGAPPVGHQHRHSHGVEDFPRHAADDHLAQARMVVAAHHHEVGTLVRDLVEDGRGHRLARGDRQLAHGGGQAVAREMARHFGPGRIFIIGMGDDPEDLHHLGPVQQRQGLGQSTRGRTAAVPGHHDALGGEGLGLDVGHDEDGAAGLHQHRLGDHLFRTGLVGIRLGDDREVVEPRQFGEAVGRDAERGGEAAHLVRETRSRRSGGEPRGCLFSGGLVLQHLGIDEVGRQGAHVEGRHVDLIRHRQPCEMGAEAGGKARRVVAGDVRLDPLGEIDQNVANHVGRPPFGRLNDATLP